MIWFLIGGYLTAGLVILMVGIMDTLNEPVEDVPGWMVALLLIRGILFCLLIAPGFIVFLALKEFMLRLTTGKTL